MSLGRPIPAPPAPAGPAVGWASAARVASGGERTLVVYVLSVGAVHVTSFVGNALALRFVDPASMGVWQTLLLAGSYLVVVRLGLVNGMGRELPCALGRGDVQRARRIASTSLAASAAASAVVAAALLASLAWLWSHGPAWRLAVPAMAVLAASNLHFTYLQATFRSGRDFALLARIHALQAGLGLLLPLTVAALGFPGLCWHAALQVVVVTAYAHLRRPLPAPPRFEPRLAGELLATGLPLFAASYLQTLALGFDRVILLHRGGVEAVGTYAPALAALAAMAIVPGAVASYVYPRLSYALGQGLPRAALRRMAVLAGLASIAVGLPLTLAGWFAAPALIERVFPQYAASITAVRWSLVAGLLWSLSPVSHLLSSLKAWRSLWAYIGSLVAARWTFPWMLSRDGDGGGVGVMEGVARGNLCAAAFAAALALLLVHRATSGGSEAVP